MKKQLLLFACLFSVWMHFGQCPTTDVVLNTQAAIDNFAINYPNCTTLTHDLKVDGETSTITNIDALISIEHAQNIKILKTQIQNLNGLSNLETAFYMSIGFNNGIQNLEGLSSLQSLDIFEVWVNQNIENFSGLDNIQSINNLNLFINPSLTNISQLSTISSLTSLSVTGNGLTSLDGLQNLHSVQEDFYMANEPIQDFNAIANLQNIGGSIYLWNFTNLDDLSIFSNITSLDDLFVVGCPNLPNLSGLENIETITGRLRIGANPEITDLSVFSNITSVYDLDIYENENLESLFGLEGLLEIDGRLLIMDNPVLTDIESIANVNPFTIDEVVLANNINLSLCDNKLICAVVDDPTVTVTVFNNNVGCNTVPEIQAICDSLSVTNFELDDLISLYPNPASERLFISTSEGIIFKNVTIYSALGERLLTSSEENINISSLSNAVYFVTITTDRGNLTKKLIKK